MAISIYKIIPISHGMHIQGLIARLKYYYYSREEIACAGNKMTKQPLCILLNTSILHFACRWKQGDFLIFLIFLNLFVPFICQFLPPLFSK